MHTEVGTPVHEAPILQAKRKVLGETVVNSAAIDERGFRLIPRARGGGPCALGRSKYQCTGTREHVRVESRRAPGKIHYRGNRGLVDIRLNVQGAAGRNIVLGIAIPAVADIGREPATKMIAITCEDTPGIGRMLIQYVAAR